MSKLEIVSISKFHNVDTDESIQVGVVIKEAWWKPAYLTHFQTTQESPFWNEVMDIFSKLETSSTELSYVNEKGEKNVVKTVNIDKARTSPESFQAIDDLYRIVKYSQSENLREIQQQFTSV